MIFKLLFGAILDSAANRTYHTRYETFSFVFYLHHFIIYFTKFTFYYGILDRKQFILFKMQTVKTFAIRQYATEIDLKKKSYL